MGRDDGAGRGADDRGVATEVRRLGVVEGSAALVLAACACDALAADAAVAVGTETVRTSLTTAPFCWTWGAILLRFFTLPRGTPKPADPSRITTCRGEIPGAVTGPRFTTTVFPPPLDGGCGTWNRAGGLITRGLL